MRHLVSTTSLLALGFAALASPAFAGDVITIHERREARRPAIAADDKGGLHIAYLSYDDGSKVPDVFHAASTDGGKTWEPGLNVSKTPGISCSPAIACGKDGHEVIVWVDTTSGMEKPDIYGVFSTDGGKTFSTALDISNTSGKSMEPAVAIAPDGTVHVLWADTTDSDRGPEIWHALSTDKGATYSKPTNVSRTLGDAKSPSIACGPKGEVYLTWADKLAERGNPDIFFSSSIDGGKTFAKATNLSKTPGVSADPDIATDEKGNIYVVWADTSTRTGQWDIFYKMSRDKGETWDAQQDLAPTPGRSTQPAIFAKNKNVAVVWRDTTAHEASPDIWLTLSSDEGKIFGAPRDISNTLGMSCSPDVTIAGGNVYAIWQEYEKGFERMKLATVPLTLH